MHKIFDWVNALKDKEVYPQAKLIETTQYDNFAFWWFLRHRLFVDLYVIFESKKKQYRRSVGRFILSKLSWLYLLSVILFSLFSKLFFPKRSIKKKAKKKLFVFLDKGDWRGFRDVKTGKYLRGLSLFGPILHRLSEKTDAFEFFSSYPFGYSFFSFVKLAIEVRISQHLGRFSPLESYLTGRSFIQILRARSMFSREFSKMKNSENRNQVFQYEGRDIFLLFQTDFEYYYKVYLPLMVQYYELSLLLLEKENPDLALIDNEYVGFARALIYACHKKGTPSLAQQHGVITEDHLGYMYAKEDISPKGSGEFPYCPLATVTSVIGPSVKDLLTKVSSYPESRVIVSGQPRYDIFYFANRLYNREAFLKRYSIDPKKKLVLLATQPFALERIREEFFFNTVTKLNSIDGIQIVIKPHPNESIHWFKEKLASLEGHVIVLSPKSDTLEAIFSCDAFLSVSSTTIIEAIIFNKPVVVVNLSQQTEPLPWVKEGAALGVYEADKIKSAVETILFEENIKAQLRRKSADFVSKHLYKIDGKATDRLISLIKRLAK
jgi:hypothetical protein